MSYTTFNQRIYREGILLEVSSTLRNALAASPSVMWYLNESIADFG